MMQEESLDDILHGVEPVEAEPQAEVEEASQAEEPTEQATPVEEPTEEAPQVEEPTEEAEEGKNWQYAAYKDEKAKRQALEQRLAELENKQEQPARPNVFEDQEAFADSLRREMQQEIAVHKLQLAQEMMRETHQDYDAEEKFFIETVAKESPILAEQAKKAANPAKFVYEQAKKYRQFQEMQDVESYREKLRAEILAEMQKEQPKQTLTRAPSATTQAPVTEYSLGELFEGR